MCWSAGSQPPAMCYFAEKTVRTQLPTRRCWQNHRTMHAFSKTVLMNDIHTHKHAHARMQTARGRMVSYYQRGTDVTEGTRFYESFFSFVVILFFLELVHLWSEYLSPLRVGEGKGARERRWALSPTKDYITSDGRGTLTRVRSLDYFFYQHQQTDKSVSVDRRYQSLTSFSSPVPRTTGPVIRRIPSELLLRARRCE